MSSFIDRSEVIKFRRIKKKQPISLPTILTNEQLQITPLKISNRTAVETSTKLPVTDLKQAPFQGADSNLHRYKPIRKRNIRTQSIQPPIYIAFHENKIKKQTDILSTHIHKLHVLEDTIRSLKEVSRLFDREYFNAFSIFHRLRLSTNSFHKRNRYAVEYCDEHIHIDTEKEKVEKQIKVNEKEQKNIEYSILFTKQAIQLHEFMSQTKLELDASKCNSIIDLHRIQKLPDELIRIIREYIPYEVRLQVIESETNIYKLCSKMSISNRNTIFNRMIQHPDISIYLHSHPLCEIFTRPIYSNDNIQERNIIKAPYTQFNIRFESIFLFIKQKLPRYAIQFITSLRNENK
jgi:hypothetical protein